MALEGSPRRVAMMQARGIVSDAAGQLPRAVYDFSALLLA